MAQGGGCTDRPVGHLGAVLFHVGRGDRLGAAHECFVGFMRPFLRSAGKEDDRRRGEGIGLSREQGEVGQATLQRRVDQIVTAPLEIMQQRSGAAFGRRQRGKQLVGPVENLQFDRGGPELRPAGRDLVRGWHVPAGNPQQRDVVSVFGEEPGKFAGRRGIVFIGVAPDRRRDHADAATTAFRLRLACSGH
ncbi:hypothetical protein [Mesorhizobium sp. M1A.F.Ca.IN.020.06.1.1]|uniref:hypothetical protein n=1 Tax=Mesorhizobium sp. M1A.F.Ca.IN.020.06.1.1 TaxID=2496765 RepID=UPI0013E401C2|nr:hypothetical protein [Mesorhizobium sp. M1A.F.Ca.IN.020.06.1.1]